MILWLVMFVIVMIVAIVQSFFYDSKYCDPITNILLPIGLLLFPFWIYFMFSIDK